MRAICKTRIADKARLGSTKTPYLAKAPYIPSLLVKLELSRAPFTNESKVNKSKVKYYNY